MIDFMGLDKASLDFIQTTTEMCDAHGVHLLISDSKFVGDGCAGFFDSESKELHVAAGGADALSWLSIFIHESCHMDQWISNDPLWDDVSEASYVIDLWIAHKIELSPEQLDDYISILKKVELDCEQRTVDKIVNHNLPIDAENYILQGNAYVYLYTMIGRARMWNIPGKSPYKNDKILELMPTHFLEYHEYDNIPSEVAKLILSECM